MYDKIHYKKKKKEPTLWILKSPRIVVKEVERVAERQVLGLEKARGVTLAAPCVV